MDKKVTCVCCGSHIANITGGIMVFNNMRAVSSIEINLIDNSKDIKCHTCHNWNNIDGNNMACINYKRKAQEHLFNLNR